MISALKYSEKSCESFEFKAFSEAWNLVSNTEIVWLNIDSIESAEFTEMCEQLALNPLLIEDLKAKNQLPKFESFENISFLSIQMIRREAKTEKVLREHLSILHIKNAIICVQDNVTGDVFKHLHKKLELNHKRLAKNGTDFLFLSIVDAIVDEYNAVIDSFRQPLHNLEVLMVKRPGTNLMRQILEVKIELNKIRKYTVPVKEEMQRIRIESPELISKHNFALYRDILDHLNTLNANFEGTREMLRDLTELNHSNQNLVLNNTMKTLTVISAIFIPLTFIAGVYGMNFDAMPWIHSKYGFATIMGGMLLLALGMAIYMRKKKWF